jgi:hypothetical protein
VPVILQRLRGSRARWALAALCGGLVSVTSVITMLVIVGFDIGQAVQLGVVLGWGVAPLSGLAAMYCASEVFDSYRPGRAAVAAALAGVLCACLGTLGGLLVLAGLANSIVVSVGR